MQPVTCNRLLVWQNRYFAYSLFDISCSSWECKGSTGLTKHKGKVSLTNDILQMVVTFGMSEIGPWSLMDSSAQSADVIMRMMARNSMSEKLAEDIDSAVKRISDSAYEIALTHVRNNREAMDKIVEVLVEKETLTGDEFRAILSEFVEIPVENRVPPSLPSPVAV